MATVTSAPQKDTRRREKRGSDLDKEFKADFLRTCKLSCHVKDASEVIC